VRRPRTCRPRSHSTAERPSQRRLSNGVRVVGRARVSPTANLIVAEFAEIKDAVACHQHGCGTAKELRR
jgi:hypothetical protein